MLVIGSIRLMGWTYCKPSLEEHSFTWLFDGNQEVLCGCLSKQEEISFNLVLYIKGVHRGLAVSPNHEVKCVTYSKVFQN